jgi:hypothetical protein
MVINMDDIKEFVIVWVALVGLLAVAFTIGYFREKQIEVIIVSVKEFPSGYCNIETVGGQFYSFKNGASFDFHPGEIWRIRYSQNIIMGAMKIGEVNIVGASE